MQAAFDTAYYSTQQKIEDALEGRNSKLAEYQVRQLVSACLPWRVNEFDSFCWVEQRAILAAGPKSAEDFDLRTALYRQIFSFVMTHAGTQVGPLWWLRALHVSRLYHGSAEST
jgi:hypothetical protein